MLKKGRGLRKRRGEPEVVETPAAEAPEAAAEPAVPIEPLPEAAPTAPDAPDAAPEAAEPRGSLTPRNRAFPKRSTPMRRRLPSPNPSRNPSPNPSRNPSRTRNPSREPEPEVDAAEDDEEAPLEAPSAQDPPPGPVLERRKLPEPPLGAVKPMELPRVIAIANQKGGVGKTTTTVNLGAALAELGFRVLVLDLDPQGNATTGLGLNPRDVEGSVYDVLLSDATLDDIVEPTNLKNLFVAPATIDLAGAEIELVPVMSRELRLKKAIDEVRDDYDIVMIDCPPSLGLLTVNGLAASDDVIVPIQCEYYALEGLGQLLRNVGLVQANLNPSLDVRGIVLTMYDARTKLADQVVSEVRAYFGEKVYETVVPRTVRLSEAPSFGQPIIVFDPTSRGAKAYRDLAKEVSRGASRRSG